MGLVKIRKKYRFDVLVLNIKEEISYTKIPLINTDFDDFYSFPRFFMEKIVNEALKSFTTPSGLPWSILGGCIP